MEERFICDRNLGKLAKWLRILGYDTLYCRGNADRDFLRKADREGRICLTRKRVFAQRRYSGRLVVIEADRVEGQIGEVVKVLSLTPDPSRRMSLCLLCNAPLEEVAREAVEGLVPVHVYENYVKFRRCSQCGRVYWPGTHRLHIEDCLRMRIPSGRP